MVKLNLVHGLAEAEGVLARLDPLDLDSLPESVLERTRQAFGDDVTPEQSVVNMLRDVRREGDAAIRRYARLLDGADLPEFRIDDKPNYPRPAPASPRNWKRPCNWPPNELGSFTRQPCPVTGWTWNRAWVKWYGLCSGWACTPPAAPPLIHRPY